MIAAIVPAAGLSSRMGRPKPLLDIDGTPLIAMVVCALIAGGSDVVVVVTPPFGRRETDAIADVASEAGAIVVVPSHETADMRASIELGLDRVENGKPPTGVLLCPCDAPGISVDLVQRVLERARTWAEMIVVPTFEAKRGHPVFLPWEVARAIRNLPAGVGVKALLEDSGSRVIEVPWSASLADVDTPEEYRRWIETARGL